MEIPDACRAYDRDHEQYRQQLVLVAVTSSPSSLARKNIRHGSNYRRFSPSDGR